jgi:dTDP-glucose 4,6-dehydratase
MNVLVTGGAGFIGSHFVRAILADRLPGLQGASVTVLDKLWYAGSSFANLTEVAYVKRLDFVPGDVADAALVDVVVRGHDMVVHLAPAHVDGAEVVLSAALRHGVARFVHLSCASVYGPVPAGAATERAPLSPTSPAAAALAGADLMAAAFHRTHGLPVMIVRGSTTYGTHQHPSATLPRAVTSLLDGRTAPMHAGRVRDWLHVDDHCVAIALTLTAGRPGETYNVGGSVELDERALFEMILAETGAGWDQVAEAPAVPGDDQRYALDDDKIRHELGWRPHVEFTTGLAATVAWYRKNRDWWPLS